MAHTKSRYMQDLGFTDARVRAVPSQELIAFGTTVLTRTAAGNINYQQAAGQTVQYTVNLSTIIQRRTGFFEDLQEQFGGAGIAGSAEYQGRPDTIASMALGQPITPRTAFKVKGVKFTGLDIFYTIAGGALTAHTCQLNQTVYANGVAPAITNLLASGANGLGTANAANVLLNIPFPAPFYLITPDQDLWFEVNVQTNAGTYTLWGFDITFEFNFN